MQNITFVSAFCQTHVHKVCSSSTCVHSKWHKNVETCKHVHLKQLWWPWVQTLRNKRKGKMCTCSSRTGHTNTYKKRKDVEFFLFWKFIYLLLYIRGSKVISLLSTKVITYNLPQRKRIPIVSHNFSRRNVEYTNLYSNQLWCDTCQNFHEKYIVFIFPKLFWHISHHKWYECKFVYP